MRRAGGADGADNVGRGVGASEGLSVRSDGRVANVENVNLVFGSGEEGPLRVDEPVHAVANISTAKAAAATRPLTSGDATRQDMPISGS